MDAYVFDLTQDSQEHKKPDPILHEKPSGLSLFQQSTSKEIISLLESPELVQKKKNSYEFPEIQTFLEVDFEIPVSNLRDCNEDNCLETNHDEFFSTQRDELIEIEDETSTISSMPSVESSSRRFSNILDLLNEKENEIFLLNRQEKIPTVLTQGKKGSDVEGDSAGTSGDLKKRKRNEEIESSASNKKLLKETVGSKKNENNFHENNRTTTKNNNDPSNRDTGSTLAVAVNDHSTVISSLSGLLRTLENNDENNDYEGQQNNTNTNNNNNNNSVMSITSSVNNNNNNSLLSILAGSNIGSRLERERPLVSPEFPRFDYEVVLVIDSRERSSSLILGSLIAAGIRCELSTLAVGDFLWVARPRNYSPPSSSSSSSNNNNKKYKNSVKTTTSAATNDPIPIPDPNSNPSSTPIAGIPIMDAFQRMKQAAAAVAAASVADDPATLLPSAPPTAPIPVHVPKLEEKTLVLDCIIERKTVADLCSSLIDGRYADQKHRIKSTGEEIPVKCYIVEGETLAVPARHLSITSTHIKTAMTTSHVSDRKTQTHCSSSYFIFLLIFFSFSGESNRLIMICTSFARGPWITLFFSCNIFTSE
jgi:ERCC4-type nuclease